MTDNEPPYSLPLNADESRQAVAAMRGYDYQIWRTVEAWISLRPEERLYIECAEDFDTVSQDAATTTQVKSSTQPISLGTAEVRETIGNYWWLRTKNPDVENLRLHFLTRGGIAHEQGSPFGTKLGLDVWRSAANGDDPSVQAIRTYLLTHIDQPPELLAYLRTASTTDLRDKLIACIEWITDEPDFDVVALSISRRLIEHGDRSRVSPTAARDAVDALLSYCRETARKPTQAERTLTRADFLAVFDDKTTLRVPQSIEVLSALGSTIAASGQPTTDITLQSSYTRGEIITTPPPLPDPILQRPALVAQVLGELTPQAPVVIAGTVGKGKTTLAKLVANSQSKPCAWVDLSSTEELRVSQVLQQLALWIEKQPGPVLVVLDDLEIGPTERTKQWTPLELLIRSCRRTSADLVLTVAGVHSEYLDSRLTSLGIRVRDVPELTLEEMKQFFSQLGCPHNLLDSLARTTQVITAGHPKLVQVQALELRDRSWPSYTINDLTETPKSIDGQRAIARLNVSTVLKGPELEFLYLLTLVTQAFSTDFAIALGSSVTELTAPGDVLGRFSGRWLENIGNGYFRVTPLLSNEAKKAWPEDRIRAGHAQIFDAYTSNKVIGTDEALSIFIHAFASEDGVRIGSFIVGLLNADNEEFSHLAREMLLITHIGSGIGTYAFSRNPGTSLLIRMLQFKIACQAAPQEARRIVKEWDWEVQQLEDQEHRNSTAVIRALVVASSTGGEIAPEDVVTAIDCLHQFEPLLIETIGGIESYEKSLHFMGEYWDPITTLFAFARMRCQTIDDLSAYLDALDRLENETRDRMLAAFDLALFADSGFILDVWTSELDKETPEWDRVESILIRAWDLASTRWNNERMAVIAARVRSIVLDEHMHDRAQAEKVLHDAKQLYPNSRILDEQSANVKFQHGEYEGVLAVWNAELTDSHPDKLDGVKDPYAYRKAAISAFKLGDYIRSAKFFSKAASASVIAALTSSVTAFYVDSAFAAFKAHKWRQAHKALLSSLDGLATDPNPESDFRSFAVQKLAGHTILWMLNYSSGSDDDSIYEPSPGFCSIPAPHSALKDEPKPPHEFLISHIVDLETKLGLPEECAHRYGSRLLESDFPFVKMRLAESKVQRAFAGRDFQDLPRLLKDLQEYYWQCLAQQRVADNIFVPFAGTPTDQDKSGRIGAEYVLLTALAADCQPACTVSDVIKEWRTIVSSLPDQDPIRLSVGTIASYFPMSLHQAATTMHQQNVRDPLRLLAATICVIASPDARPEDTAFAQAAFIFWSKDTPAQNVLACAVPGITECLCQSWARHASKPATLRNPRTNIPDFERVFAMQPDGAHKLRELFSVARAATNVRVPSAAMNWILQQEVLESRRLETDN